jgi:hypothetical protein
MRVIPFLKRFFLYITVLFLVWAPIAGKYFAASVVMVNLENFILFYIPLNFIPFMSLILASELKIKKTIRILILGLVLTVAFNLIIIYLQIFFFSYQDQLLYTYAIGRIAFPLLLWLVFTHDMIFDLESVTNPIENK